MNQIDKLLTAMLDRGGSDLHLSVGAPPRARIHGVIHPLNDDLIDEAAMEQILKEVTPQHRWVIAAWSIRRRIGRAGV